LLYNSQIHDLGTPITDLQWSRDRTYLITACQDKTAKLVTAKDLEVLKTYVSDTPLNSATMTLKKDFVILGGGQAAENVTTTAARQGKFEARFYHKIFENEIGRVRGHFGPLVSLCPNSSIALSEALMTRLILPCRTALQQTRLARDMQVEVRTVMSAFTNLIKATSTSFMKLKENA
jgi:WD40 repeat protein